MAPLKTVLTVSMVLLLTACGSKGGDKSSDSAPVAQKLRLKGTGGVANVMLNASIDLRKRLENAEGASFEIVEGAQRAEWVQGANAPILHMIQAGEVTVLVTDAAGEVSVALKFKVVFDSTGALDPIDAGDASELPEDPDNPVLHL